MGRDLQTWLIVISLGLLIAIQFLLIGTILRLSRLLKPKPGGPGVREIATKAMETMDAVKRATNTTAELVDQTKPVAVQAARISGLQLAHAEQVVDDVLSSVERINQNVRHVNSAVSLSFREANALSAGVRSAVAKLVGKEGDSNERKQW